MTLRTDDELNAALTALAAAEGTSKQEVVRRAVLERLERLERIDEIAAGVIVEYADALERLGKA